MSTATATGTPVAAVPPAGPKPIAKRRTASMIWGVVAWVAGIVFVFPVIWMVLTSFKQEQAAASNPPSWFFTPTLAQYEQIFDRNVTPFLLNSLMASVFSTLFVVLLATPAAYALSLRPVAKWTDTLFFFISTKMMPAVAALLPIYLLAKHLGMLDNIWTMVILTIIVATFALRVISSLFKMEEGR